MKKKNNFSIILSIILGVLLIISVIINFNYFYNKSKEDKEITETIPLTERINSVDCNKNDFEMSLFADKYTYKTTDKIKIGATLKYIGKNATIKIWHAGSTDSDTYFDWLITNGKEFNVQSVSNMMLKSTILYKDKLYYFDYQKSGGYAADDPNAKYWEKFYKENDLYLPVGEYTIKLKSIFNLSDEYETDNLGLLCELKIKVEE